MAFVHHIYSETYHEDQIGDEMRYLVRISKRAVDSKLKGFETRGMGMFE